MSGLRVIHRQTVTKNNSRTEPSAKLRTQTKTHLHRFRQGVGAEAEVSVVPPITVYSAEQLFESVDDRTISRFYHAQKNNLCEIFFYTAKE